MDLPAVFWASRAPTLTQSSGPTLYSIPYLHHRWAMAAVTISSGYSYLGRVFLPWAVLVLFSFSSLA